MDYVIVMTQLIVCILLVILLGRVPKPAVVIKKIEYDYERILTPDGTVIQFIPNQDIRKYHFDFPPTPDMMKEIWDVRGVIDDDMHRSVLQFNDEAYCVKIEKGKAFKWKEVEPEILEIINRYRVVDEHPGLRGEG